MRETPLRLQVGEGQVWAVPAVHFRVAFAEEVHRLCADPATRPEAVAVELGPQVAGAAVAWLGELGSGPGERRALPCMLGLARANRRLKPSVRELARELERATGKRLDELPPELLSEALGYASYGVLYLSPTDSIIEALRCALELQVPVYGVDLDETPTAERRPVMLQDPALIGGRVEGYVARNAAFAEAQRDPEVDDRRELAMAARLKSVAASHRRVLFTGGLAHWTRLQRLLADPAVHPAPVAPVREPAAGEFRRVVVDPRIAIHHMDLFPAFTQVYEDRRLPADQPRRVPQPVDQVGYLGDVLHALYEQYFTPDEGAQQLDRNLEDLDACPDFEQLLANLCLVRQQAVPDLFTAVQAAEASMSPRFAKALGEYLMEFPWACRRDLADRFPDLLSLVSAPTGNGRHLRAQFVNDHLRRSDVFYIDSQPDRARRSATVSVAFRWEDDEWPPVESSVDRRTWRPRDLLFTAMSLRAKQLGSYGRGDDRVEPFEGSLLEGVHVKATLRARIRGDGRLHVRDRRPSRQQRGGPSEVDLEPIVWIFRPGRAPGASFFSLGNPIAKCRPYFRDEALWRRAADPGGWLTTVIAFGVGSEPVPELSRWGIDRARFRGLTMYLPMHFMADQDCAAAETLGLRRTPVIPGDILDFFREQHGLLLGAADWPTALVRMAIPYADRAVTVVAPDGFRLPSIVFSEAARRPRPIQIAVVPLSCFPREQVARTAEAITAPVVEEGGTQHFPESIERLLGERADTYGHLVPASLLHYRAPGPR